ncbi:MAG: ORF6N domain-containing protein [Symploca sp. SIO1B1]|nr:ORF6N domain-containing protein [Symploca sp. SIO1B1]
MAEFYEVPKDTVKSTVKNNKEELESDGLDVLTGQQLKDVGSIVDLRSKSPSLTIWTPRTALRLGMLLRDSEVAKAVRTSLLDVAEKSNPIRPQLPAPKEIAEAIANSLKFLSLQ